MSLRSAVCATGILCALLLAAPASAQQAEAPVYAQATIRPVPGPLRPVRANQVMWINHLAFLPGDPSVRTSFNAVSSGVGGGLSGLTIESNATGDTTPTGGNKVVEAGLQVPPGFVVSGVRVCYELSNTRSFITQTRLAQLQDPPSSAVVRLDDGADLNAAGPTCVNSQATSVDPSAGAVRLSFRVNFGATTDRIVIRAVGLLLAPRP